jgi:hypothetical protein
MTLNDFVLHIKEKFPDLHEIDPEIPLNSIGFDSLNIADLIVVCSELFPQFDYNENFIFFEDTTLKVVFNTLSGS